MTGEVRIGTSGWGLDVQADINNDERAYAPRDALQRRELVG